MGRVRYLAMSTAAAATLALAGCVAMDEDAALGATAQPASQQVEAAPVAEEARTTAPAPDPLAVSADMIPREAIFGNPERAGAQISPDGTQLSWIAPLDGVLNIWVAPVDDPEAARAVTSDTGRGIRGYFWAPNATHIVYVQDKGGDENFRAYSVNLETGEEINLTPFDGVRAALYATDWDAPNMMMVGVNNRDPRWHDLYKVDVTTGERELIYENTDEIADYTFDRDLNLRLALRSNPDGSQSVLKPTDEGWEGFYVIPYADSLSSGVLGFTVDGTAVHALESMGRDKTALVRIDYETGERTVIASSDKADIGGLMVHPTEYVPEAYAVNYLKREWTALDPEVGEDLDFLRANLEGEISVADRTRDDTVWLISNGRSDKATTYHLYDREAETLTELFGVRPQLEGYTLARMHPVEIDSRDGKTLVSYLTLPPGSDPDGDGVPSEPVPLVLDVHGGPWARDSYGYSSWHQWLANRGYGVLSVNFRGSTGFGKAFIRAGDKEWGRKMQDDLLDGVDWAVERGITTDDQVAITGGSYGGYATLAGLAFTPEEFACGVSIVGPSNLNTLLTTIPPYWEAFRTQFTNAIGDPETEEGQALLKERSPLTNASDIARPLLIGQGANDPRVVQAESDQIVEAMKAQDIPVTYILFPDEGHGFARPENRLAFYAVMESFLAGCLGGRYEPVGDDFEGSSLEAVHGADYAPGLKKALEGFEPEQRG